MKNSGGWYFASGLFVGAIGALILVLLVVPATTVSYRDGQIDALTGKIKYELVKQPNGEIHWQKID